MKIGLIDVDGHNFPNLALMRISAYHKAHGDSVEWYAPLLTGRCDIVYASKVFNFSQDFGTVIDADHVVRGGTGYAISMQSGREVYDNTLDTPLSPEIERCFPDYSIYSQYDFAVAMTSRGCPRGCGFCHVTAKEGRKSVCVADVSDFWNGQDKIYVLDPNISACPQKRELFRQYRETGALIEFSQGLDIRLTDDDDIADLNRMRIQGVHFAWDNPKDDLTAYFKRFAAQTKRKPHGAYGTVYVLTNYDSTMDENLYRIYTLRDIGFDPYAMIYDKYNAPQEIRRLQRWCNNRIIANACKRFEDYSEKREARRTARTKEDT